MARQSPFIVVIGLTLAALNAGTAHASSVATVTVTGRTVNVATSCVVTPNRTESISRASGDVRGTGLFSTEIHR